MEVSVHSSHVIVYSSRNTKRTLVTLNHKRSGGGEVVYGETTKGVFEDGILFRPEVQERFLWELRSDPCSGVVVKVKCNGNKLDRLNSCSTLIYCLQPNILVGLSMS